MAYTIPSDSHKVGDNGHTTDHNNIADMLALLAGGGMTLNVKNTAYGATGNGSTDDTAAIQSAINAATTGGVVAFPPATYLLNSSPLTVTTNGVSLAGVGQGASTLLIGASFSGTAAVNVTGANDVAISGLWIKGNSSTYSSNPAADAIRFNNSQRPRVCNCLMYYINGYAVSVLANSSGSSIWPYLSNVHAVQCAQGAHILGNTNSGYDAGATLEGCIFENIQGADALLVEDAHDVSVTDLEAWNASGSTGNCVHIKGNSAAVFLSNPDIGGLSGSTPQAHAAMLVESGSNGTPAQICVEGGIIEASTPGLSVTAGTEIKFGGTAFYTNANYGASVAGGSVLFQGCSFNDNGYTAGAANFDAVTSGGITRFESCEFLTPGGSSSQQVASAVNAGGTTYVQHCRFGGATAFGSGGGTYPTLARNNVGYNPVGPVSPPAVPGSATALTNPFGNDCLVCVTGGTVSSIAIGGTATGLINGPFRLPWNQNIKITYTSAPTWVWIAE